MVPARGELVMKLEPLLRVKTKENQKLSSGKGKQKSADLKVVPVETRVELGLMAGVSHDTILGDRFRRNLQNRLSTPARNWPRSPASLTTPLPPAGCPGRARNDSVDLPA
jgi:hypothetical protein